MDSKPLSYESLKNVLQYMDANVRFQISHRCPTIQKTERIVPLKIEYLEFEHMQLTVNKTKYGMGLYRKYHGDKVPKLIEDKNDYGGVKHELDQFGFENVDAWEVVLPGDVLVKDRSYQTSYFFNDEQHGQGLERRLADLEIEWNLQQILRVGSSEDLEKRIDKLRTRLIPYRCRRDNIEAPFDNYVQLTIATPSGKHIERVNYNKKLYEAYKYVSCKLFGERCSTVHVKHFQVSSNNTLIRLPLGLKFKIRELGTNCELAMVYEALTPIVEESSYPLEVLHLYHISQNSANLVHKVNNAKKLIIVDMLSEDFLSHKRRHVHVFLDREAFTIEFRILLVRNWLETGREVGTVYTFGISNKIAATYILRSIKKQFKETVSGQQCLILPMSPVSELKISYKAVTIDEYFKEPWLLTMEVLPVGSGEDNVADKS